MTETMAVVGQSAAIGAMAQNGAKTEAVAGPVGATRMGTVAGNATTAMVGLNDGTIAATEYGDMTKVAATRVGVMAVGRETVRSS